MSMTRFRKSILSFLRRDFFMQTFDEVYNGIEYMLAAYNTEFEPKKHAMYQKMY